MKFQQLSVALPTLQFLTSLIITTLIGGVGAVLFHDCIAFFTSIYIVDVKTKSICLCMCVCVCVCEAKKYISETGCSAFDRDILSVFVLSNTSEFHIRTDHKPSFMHLMPAQITNSSTGLHIVYH